MEIEEEVEKLMDWKREIEQGWIDIGQYCSKCKCVCKGDKDGKTKR